MPSDADFTATGTTGLDTCVGVALTGVLLLGAVSANSVDPIYPAVYGTVTDVDDAKESFDACLAHP